MNGAGLAQNLAALDVGLGDTTQQGADVVAGLSVVQQLAEHLDAGDDGLLLLVGQADDLDVLASLIRPRSTRPVATVPRPEMVNTSSTGIRKGRSSLRAGVGI